jgi:hypothetical protein
LAQIKKFAVSFCDGAYRVDHYENLYKPDHVASVGFEPREPVKCRDECETCEAGAPHMCIVCAANRVNPPFCECQNGFFEEYGKCVPCSYKCIACKSADECDVCAGNRVTPPACICPHNTYDE